MPTKQDSQDVGMDTHRAVLGSDVKVGEGVGEEQVTLGDLQGEVGVYDPGQAHRVLPGHGALAGDGRDVHCAVLGHGIDITLQRPTSLFPAPRTQHDWKVCFIVAIMYS